VKEFVKVDTMLVTEWRAGRSHITHSIHVSVFHEHEVDSALGLYIQLKDAAGNESRSRISNGHDSDLARIDNMT